MILGSTVLLARLLYDVLRRGEGPRRGVTERVVAERGSFPDLEYRPRGRSLGTLVLVHGVTARASRDRQLVQLARALAARGYRCRTPALHDLARFSHDPSDIDGLAESIATAAEDTGGPVGVLGFSYGASYALAAAADRRARDSCRALVAFGAYYRLSEALAHQRQWLEKNPDPSSPDSDLLYLRYTLLACHRQEIDLPERAWQDIDRALLDFTARGPIGPKQRPLLEHARHIDYLGLMDSYLRRSLSERLSPASRLAEVRCGVGLLHDPEDRFVPARHTAEIARELDQRPRAVPTQVLTTPMFAHVRVVPGRQLLHLFRLARLMEPLLGR